MKFSFSTKSKLKAKKTILFVCVQNAGRSQMAEGSFSKYAPEGFETMSAGTKPTSQINSLAIQAMNEIGIDISKQKSKDLTEDMMRNSNKIINMGCMDKNFCPALFIPKLIDWGIEDPKDKPIEKVREIRDRLRRESRNLQETFLSLKKKTVDKLTLNQKRFIVEVIGTFIVVATGAVVIDAKFNGILGISFIAFLPFIGVAAGVYLFGKISMAHFNPSVTLGFLITKHITKLQLVYYFTAEILGALLGSLFVMYVIGREANLGTNSPNYAFSLPAIFGIEVLASALLMSVIVLVVFTKGLRGYGGLVIGGIVGLDIFFLAFISGASMNPARSLAPALVSGVLDNLWLYWSATFIGTSIVALLAIRLIYKSRSIS